MTTLPKLDGAMAWRRQPLRAEADRLHRCATLPPGLGGLGDALHDLTGQSFVAGVNGQVS
jgi:hypothetical protein